MVGALKAHQRDALPVVALHLAGFIVLLGDDIGAGVGKAVRLQHTVIRADETVHTSAVHDLNLGMFGLIVFLHHIDMDSSVQDGVVSVRPEWQDLISRKAPESQLPVFVVGIEPGLSTNPCALTNIVHGTQKTGPEQSPQGLGILLVFGVKGQRTAKGVVGLLVHHLGIEVVDQPVVGQVLEHNGLAILIQRQAFPVGHILVAVIVGLTLKLLFALRAGEPCGDFKLQKALVRHAPFEIGGHTAIAIIPQIECHHWFLTSQTFCLFPSIIKFRPLYSHPVRHFLIRGPARR